ncbi:MAG: copper resistance protein CopC/CopD [Gemmatimonadetes bacterium]|nr:copper resistance protein CopC/CopD [Gemmatimonadota bacterium]
MSRSSRRAAFLAGMAVLAIPALVWAHGALKSSAPAPNAKLDRPPESLVLTFTDPSPLSVTRVRLVGADSAVVALGPLEHVPGSGERGVRAPVVGRMAAGTYAVDWQTAGSDGHPVKGRFTFVVLTGAAPLEDSVAANAASGTPMEQAPAAAEATFDAESPLYALIRFVTFTGLVTLLGVVVFVTGVLSALARNADAAVPMGIRNTATKRALELAVGATVVLGVAGLARLGAQSYALFGADALDLRSVWGLVGGTSWGTGWTLQMVGVVAALIAVAMVRRAHTRASKYGWPLLTVAAIALAMTPALSGHASSGSGDTGLAVLADTLHVIGAGGWIGTLLLVVSAGIPAAWTLPEGDRELAVATIVRAFSPIALVFTGVLGATGLFAAWIHLTAIADIWQSPYGRTLVLKLAILSAVAATGWYNWKRVTPRLETAAGVRLLRRTAVVEVGIAVLVLAVTAVLVATPPPSEMEMGGAAAVGVERVPTG